MSDLRDFLAAHFNIGTIPSVEKSAAVDSLLADLTAFSEADWQALGNDAQFCSHLYSLLYLLARDKDARLIAFLKLYRSRLTNEQYKIVYFGRDDYGRLFSTILAIHVPELMHEVMRLAPSDLSAPERKAWWFMQDANSRMPLFTLLRQYAGMSQALLETSINFVLPPHTSSDDVLLLLESIEPCSSITLFQTILRHRPDLFIHTLQLAIANNMSPQRLYKAFISKLPYSTSKNQLLVLIDKAPNIALKVFIILNQHSPTLFWKLLCYSPRNQRPALFRLIKHSAQLFTATLQFLQGLPLQNLLTLLLQRNKDGQLLHEVLRTQAYDEHARIYQAFIANLPLFCQRKLLHAVNDNPVTHYLDDDSDTVIDNVLTMLAGQSAENIKTNLTSVNSNTNKPLIIHICRRNNPQHVEKLIHLLDRLSPLQLFTLLQETDSLLNTACHYLLPRLIPLLHKLNPDQVYTLLSDEDIHGRLVVSCHFQSLCDNEHFHELLLQLSSEQLITLFNKGDLLSVIMPFSIFDEQGVIEKSVNDIHWMLNFLSKLPLLARFKILCGTAKTRKLFLEKLFSIRTGDYRTHQEPLPFMHDIFLRYIELLLPLTEAEQIAVLKAAPDNRHWLRHFKSLHPTDVNVFVDTLMYLPKATRLALFMIDCIDKQHPLLQLALYSADSYLSNAEAPSQVMRLLSDFSPEELFIVFSKQSQLDSNRTLSFFAFLFTYQMREQDFTHFVSYFKKLSPELLSQLFDTFKPELYKVRSSPQSQRQLLALLESVDTIEQVEVVLLRLETICGEYNSPNDIYARKYLCRLNVIRRAVNLYHQTSAIGDPKRLVYALLDKLSYARFSRKAHARERNNAIRTLKQRIVHATSESPEALLRILLDSDKRSHLSWIAPVIRVLAYRFNLSLAVKDHQLTLAYSDEAILKPRGQALLG